MLHRFISGLVIASFSLCTAMSHAAGAHVHGLAKILVASDGNDLEIEFISPLDNLIGFERAPRNDKERKAVENLMRHLNAPHSLFVTPIAATCTHIKTAVDAPILQSPSKSKHVHGKHDNQHAEITAVFSFQCTNPAALKSIELRLFDVFPNLQRVQAEVASKGGQAASSLDRAHRTLSW